MTFDLLTQMLENGSSGGEGNIKPKPLRSAGEELQISRICRMVYESD